MLVAIPGTLGALGCSARNVVGDVGGKRPFGTGGDVAGSGGGANGSAGAATGVAGTSAVGGGGPGGNGVSGGGIAGEHVPFGPYTATAIRDVNGDGKPDLVVVGGVLLNTTP